MSKEAFKQAILEQNLTIRQVADMMGLHDLFPPELECCEFCHKSIKEKVCECVVEAGRKALKKENEFSLLDYYPVDQPGPEYFTLDLALDIVSDNITDDQCKILLSWFPEELPRIGDQK